MNEFRQLALADAGHWKHWVRYVRRQLAVAEPAHMSRNKFEPQAPTTYPAAVVWQLAQRDGWLVVDYTYVYDDTLHEIQHKYPTVKFGNGPTVLFPRSPA